MRLRAFVKKHLPVREIEKRKWQNCRILQRLSHYASTGICELCISLLLTKVQRSNLKIEAPIAPPISAKKLQAEPESKQLSKPVNTNLPEWPQPGERGNTTGRLQDDHLA